MARVAAPPCPPLPRAARSGPAAVAAMFALVGCPAASVDPEPATPPAPPAPDAWGGTTGPGGPASAFAEAELGVPCAALVGGPDDAEHHNLVVPYDGYLLMPWAPEYSNGGLTFFEVRDPCAPVKVGEGTDRGMRETHSVGFRSVGGRDYAAVNHHGGVDVEAGTIVGGVQIWDITDRTAPTHVVDVRLPGYLYPDAYERVTLSLFWPGRYLYAASADNGVHVVDTLDPTAPEVVAQHTFDPVLRLGAFHVLGNVAMASSAEGARTVMMDLSDPTDPQPLPGGEFFVTDDAGEPREYYFANLGGPWALFARKQGGGGPVIYDVSDPSAPTRLGMGPSDGNGGYVFRQHELLFVGESSFAGIYDATDPTAPQQLTRLTLTGDLDTMTPLGNVAALSVDDDPDPGLSTVLVPFAAEPDRRGPSVGMSAPRDGATFQPLATRVGLSFDEMVEPRSVFAGSLRVADEDGWPVAGSFTAQENIVHFEPDAPLTPDTTYVVTVPAGGITDFAGNPTEATWTIRFATGAEVVTP